MLKLQNLHHTVSIFLNNENPDTEEFQNSKRVINNLRGRKDNSANMARRIIGGSVVGKTSNRPMRSNCKILGVSFRTLKQAIPHVNNFGHARFIRPQFVDTLFIIRLRTERAQN